MDVKLSPPQSRTPPELIWIGTSNTSSCLYPNYMELAGNSLKNPPLKAFLESIRLATNQLWLMDPHFDGKALQLLERALELTNLKNVRIISKKEIPRKVIIDIKKLNQSDEFNIEWKQGFSYLHDRFALVDFELWHFGSTIGGTYNGFSACTKGWDGKEFAQLHMNRWEKL